MRDFESQKLKARPLFKHKYWAGGGGVESASFTFDVILPLFHLAFL